MRKLLSALWDVHAQKEFFGDIREYGNNSGSFA